MGKITYPKNNRNAEIREAILKSGLRHYAVAEMVGVSADTLAHWLMSEMNEERKQRVLSVLKQDV